MKKIIIGIIIVVVSVIALVLATGIYKFNFTNDDIYFACPEDARICSDGSAVVRVGPDCEFAVCPVLRDMSDDNQITCTAEAKICPDGSAVGRIGPDYEFASCPVSQSALTEAEARLIAEKICVKSGEALGEGMYNPNSKTWWFDANLNSTPEGCNPACVVSEETRDAEINWRCTGLIR